MNCSTRSNNRLFSVVSLLVGGLALTLAGCAASNTAAPAPKTAAASQSKAETISAESAKPAAAKENSTPEPAAPAVKNQPSASVTARAVDQTTGKAVDLAFETIYFDLDQYVIRPEFLPAIKHNAELLRHAPNVHVVIEGHCDERGTTEYNLALGQRRAIAVYQALAAESVAKNQMKTISYGKEMPDDKGHTEQAWAKNRRDQIRAS